ncbi:MAG: hypothetical protein ACYCVW_16655 [Rhodocyclaceae bacterium]
MTTSLSTSSINDVPPSATQKVAWYNVIGQWRQAVADFDKNLAAVQSQSSIAASLQSTNPTLYASYQSIMQQVPGIQSRISELDGAIADVENWLAGAWSDVTGAWNYVKTSVTSLFGMPGGWSQATGLGDLGQWQLVPLAVVAAGVAYVGAKAMDLYNVHTKLAAVQSYIAKGYSPAAASALVAQTTTTPSLFSGISTTLKYSALALAAGGILLYMLKRGRK